MRLETRSDVVGARDERSASTARTRSNGRRGCGRLAGIRADGSRYRVDALDPANSGTTSAGAGQPEGRRDVRSVEGDGVLRERRHRLPQQQRARHDDHARRRRQAGRTVTPLVRAKGAEVGVRTVAVPHLQTTVSLWTLRLGSELVYNGDIGATEPGPASERHGVEIANYYSPLKWLVFDADLSLSRAHFTGDDLPGSSCPRRSAPSSRRAPASTDSIGRSAASGGATSARARSSRTTRCARRRRAW